MKIQSISKIWADEASYHSDTYDYKRNKIRYAKSKKAPIFFRIAKFSFFVVDIFLRGGGAWGLGEGLYNKTTFVLSVFAAAGCEYKFKVGIFHFALYIFHLVF